MQERRDGIKEQPLPCPELGGPLAGTPKPCRPGSPRLLTSTEGSELQKVPVGPDGATWGLQVGPAGRTMGSAGAQHQRRPHWHHGDGLLGEEWGDKR